MEQHRRRAARHAAHTALLVLLLAARVASAQCPDGAPPPCRSAATLTRRAAPALNDRTWIVVPFTNVTRAPDLEWLRDASANLLSLDLGRWTDIGVVDDKRVADLLRTLPAQRVAQALSLADGMALARQAGAGRLVMGDFIKIGRGTRLVANVFEVRNGTRLRSVQQPVADPDSLLAAFGPLARAVLAVPPPNGDTTGTVGTTSADAYREYLLGLASLHRFELTDARRHLLLALDRDSLFALAHYKLSIVMHWQGLQGSAAERSHAVAAARLGGALPPRERALISSRLAGTAGDHERACATLTTLAQHDSSDVEALYGLGDCKYHAGLLSAEPTADTTRGRFRGDWNGALRIFRRALMLDPSYHPAFAHLLDILTTVQIAVCVEPGPGCANDTRAFVAWVVRDADTLLIQPVRGNYTVKTPWRVRQDATRTPLLNLRQAQRIAREWTDAGPAEGRAHLNLGILDMKLGELAAAESELALVPATADAFARTSALEARVQLATLLGNGAAGRAALDTLARELPDDSTKAIRIGALGAAFGRVRSLVAALDNHAVSHAWPAAQRAYLKHRPYVLLGIPLPSMVDDERRYAESIPGDTMCLAGRPNCRTTNLLFTLSYAPRVARTWTVYPRPPVGLRFLVSYAIMKNDSAYTRVVAQFVDSLAIAAHSAGNDDLGTPATVGEAYLALHDSANAMRTVRWSTDTSLVVQARNSSSNDGWDWPYLAVPRMLRLRADLAAKLGFADEARTWYEKAINLWTDADPELKPEVDRMRAAVAALRRAR